MLPYIYIYTHSYAQSLYFGGSVGFCWFLLRQLEVCCRALFKSPKGQSLDSFGFIHHHTNVCLYLQISEGIPYSMISRDILRLKATLANFWHDPWCHGPRKLELPDDGSVEIPLPSPMAFYEFGHRKPTTDRWAVEFRWVKRKWVLRNMNDLYYLHIYLQIHIIVV